MKKVLLLIISVLSVIHAYAQNDDSLQVQSAAITIDSLSSKLDKLQHDYNYLSCDFELYRMKMELNELSQDVSIKTNDVIINGYHGGYNREMYTSFSNYYDAYCALYDALKYKYEHVKTLVMLKTVTYNFSDEEIGAISASFTSIDKSVSTIDVALKFFEAMIRTYRSNR